MSTVAERIAHAADPGYWAVEIRLVEAYGRGKRYLCHADNNHMAFSMALRLAGSTRNVLGFSSRWIEEQALNGTQSALPSSGAYEEVSDAQAWDRLITAHEASEIALAGRQAQAPA